MKFNPDPTTGNTISGYGPGWVSVNGQRFHSNVLIGHNLLEAWDCGDFASLRAENFSPIASQNPEVLIFGSGERLQFPPAEVLRGLYAQRIGVETMDTQAACRTYNFLLGEGRRVIAALLIA